MLALPVPPSGKDIAASFQFNKGLAVLAILTNISVLVTVVVKGF